MVTNYNRVFEGIIIKIVRYRDSKAIVHIITPEHGVIQAHVTGIRAKKSNLQGVISLLNYIKFEAGKTNSSEIYSIRNVELVSSLSYTSNYNVFLYQNAAVELLDRTALNSDDDSASIFHLLGTYLEYIASIEKNHVLIFWRFVLRYFSLLGIPLNLTKCNSCNSGLEDGFAYSTENHGFACLSCSSIKDKHISQEAQEILILLPTIGNYIEDLNIEQQVEQEIHRLLLLHISTTLHKEVSLRSLSIN